MYNSDLMIERPEDKEFSGKYDGKETGHIILYQKRRILQTDSFGVTYSENEFEEPVFDDVIKHIVSVDFHEFVHYFLDQIKIENDLCLGHKNKSSKCWWCNYTQTRLPIRVSETHTTKKEFESKQNCVQFTRLFVNGV